MGIFDQDNTSVIRKQPNQLFWNNGKIDRIITPIMEDRLTADKRDWSTRQFNKLTESPIGQLYSKAEQIPVVNFVLPSTEGLTNFVDNRSSAWNKATGALEAVPLLAGTGYKGFKALNKVVIPKFLDQAKAIDISGFSDGITNTASKVSRGITSKIAEKIKSRNMIKQARAEYKSLDNLNPSEYTIPFKRVLEAKGYFHDLSSKELHKRPFEYSELGKINNPQVFSNPLHMHKYESMVNSAIFNKFKYLPVYRTDGSYKAMENIILNPVFSKNLSEINSSYNNFFKNYDIFKSRLRTLSDNSRRVLETKNRILQERNNNITVDWGKWNKEILDNKPLLEEYSQIEKATKSDGSFLRNFKADYSEMLFKNTGMTKDEQAAAQFIQSKSKNYLKAYPNGVEQMYRGVKLFNPISTSGHARSHNILDEFVTKTGDRSIFGANRGLAKRYSGADWLIDPNDTAQRNGLISLIHPKSTSIEFNVHGKNWANLPIDLSNNQLVKRASIRGNKTPGLTTNKIADFIERHDIGIAKLNNIDDGGRGSVRIMNNKAGQYVKSRIGNNGMFDLNDPNILKGFAPIGAMGLANQDSIFKK